MSTRNHVLALIFLMGVLAFTVFAAKRLLFRATPAGSGAASPPHAVNPATKPAVPKPSAAVAAPSSAPSSSPAPAKPAPAASAPTTPAPAVSAAPAPAPPAPARSAPAHVAPAPSASARATPAPKPPARYAPAPSAGARATPAPAPKTREKTSAPPAKKAVAVPPKAQPHAPKRPAVAAKNHHSEDHHPENQHAEADRPQLRFGSGVRLWIQVIAINRKPGGSFTFRGTLLQPVTLANRSQLNPGTGVAGSETADNGHIHVQVSGFTVAGANYELLDSGSSGRSGTGLAVELDPGKLLEVWLASSSVYRKTP